MKARLVILALLALVLVGFVVTACAYVWWLIFSPARGLEIEYMADEMTCAAVTGHRNWTLSKWFALAAQRGEWYGVFACRIMGAVVHNHCQNSLK